MARGSAMATTSPVMGECVSRSVRLEGRTYRHDRTATADKTTPYGFIGHTGHSASHDTTSNGGRHMAWIGKAVGLTLAGFLAVGTVQAVLATPDTPATAQTAPSTSHTAYCAAHAPRAGHWPRAREIGASRLTWQYVTRDEARYFHISPCSVVIAGNGQSVILTPRGNVVAKS